ncbi:MAG TPA: prolyl oligopeptidase family serine peptidase [Caulobacteraceae bacterium]
MIRRKIDPGWVGALKIRTVVGALCAGAALASAASAAPPPLEAYGALPAVEMMRISPNGDRIAWITTTGADRKLHVADAASGQILHEVDCADIKLRALDWADEDHVVVTASVTMTFVRGISAAAEFMQVVALDVPRHSLMVVFNNQPTLLPLVFGAYGYSSQDGHAYGYYGGIRRNDLRYKSGATTNLYRVDLDTDAWLFVGEGAFRDQQWLVDPRTGSVSARALTDEHSGEWRIEEDGTVLDHGKADYGAARLLGFGKDGKGLLVAEPTAGDDRIREVSAFGAVSEEVKDGGAITEFEMDRRTGKWIGEAREADRPQITFFDRALQARLDMAMAVVGSDRNPVLVSYDDDLSHIILKTEGDNDSGTWLLVDTRSKNVKTVGRAYPDISPDEVGAFSMVDWKAADGLDLHGVLTLPPGKPAKNLPLVVLPHGGPQLRDYPHFDWWAQAFASRGYAVFQPNYRGSAGYGEAFVAAGYGQWGRKMQTDISDGVAELARRGVIDPRRACIVGGSYGGYAALAGVTVQHDLYRCSVSWGGVADLKDMQMAAYRGSGSRSSDATRYWNRFMGGDGPKPLDIAAVSPAKLAGSADAPILLMYGHDDTVVPPRQSIEMANALKKAGKPVEVQVMPGEDHWLSRGATRTAMLQAAVAFVEKNDPPD